MGNIFLFRKNFSIFIDMERERELAEEKMKAFLKSGFSILLIGERGVGKSKIYGKKGTEKINCAAFAEDNTLETELFGVEKGIYTGVAKRDGALVKANGKKLFLDEVHHLSKVVQAKLMTAFGTDSENYMEFYKVGTNIPIKVRCQLIFATNKTIEELKEVLLPDFYDRIVQNVIEIPPLRKTEKDREKDWKSVWEHMKFDIKSNALKDDDLRDWLKSLPLHGNYRDLEKIAIYYNVFEKNFSEELKNMIPEKTAFEYAKSQFEKYKSPEPKIEENNMIIKLNLVKNSDEIHKDFNFELQKRAIEQHGNKKEAAKVLDVNEKTLNNWKNRS
jgi:transcriptional regulator with AAA-type ATPase domain